MREIVSMKDFKKLDVRIGTIAEVERVPGSRNLYKLQVDMGDEMRQIPIFPPVAFYQRLPRRRSGCSAAPRAPSCRGQHGERAGK